MRQRRAITTLANCQLSFNSPNCNYSNRAAFAAARVTYRTAPSAIPFMISDAAGSYAVENPPSASSRFENKRSGRTR